MALPLHANRPSAPQLYAEALSIPLPPSPHRSRRAQQHAHAEYLPKQVPGTAHRIPAVLEFQAFGAHYKLKTVVPSTLSIESHVNALVHKYAIPDHHRPDLMTQVGNAVQTAISHLDTLRPSRSDHSARIGQLVASYAGSPRVEQDATLFAHAYNHVIHSPITGLLDAILVLQIRYAFAMTHLTTKRDHDLARLALIHAQEQATDPALGVIHKAEYAQAKAMWQTHLGDLGAQQLQEFQFFVMAVAHVLERNKDLSFDSLMAQVFDVELGSFAATKLLTDQKLRFRASTFSGSSASLPEHQSSKSLFVSTDRRTLRKSASAQLLQVAASGAAKPDITDTPKLSCQTDSSKSQLMEMGFSASYATAALAMANSDVERALSILLEKNETVKAHIEKQHHPAHGDSSISRSVSNVQRKLAQRLGPQRYSTDPVPSPKSSGSGSSSWSPMRLFEVGESVHDKLSGWFDLGPSTATKASAEPGPRSASPTQAESFQVYLGTQLKVAFVVTLIRLPQGLASYMVPPTPPLDSSITDHPGEWRQAIAVRSRMAIDLYRTLHLLVVPYPLARSLDKHLVSHLSESLGVPELVFPDLVGQFTESISKLPEMDGGDHLNSLDHTSSHDRFGHVLLTKHSNLACGNAMAHVIPHVSPIRADADSGSPAIYPDLQLLKALISQVRPSDAVDFSIPITFQPTDMVGLHGSPPQLTGSALVHRIEAVIKSVRGSLLDRSRVRVFGAPDFRINSAAPSLSTLSVPSEGNSALEGGTVTFLCVSENEWEVGHQLISLIFKTG